MTDDLVDFGWHLAQCLGDALAFALARRKPEIRQDILLGLSGPGARAEEIGLRQRTKALQHILR
jgi:hypothetical protein